MTLKKLYVIKRDGRRESVKFDKITTKIEKLCNGLDMDYIDPPSIAKEVINGLYSGITTVKLDNMAAEIAVSCIKDHPHYGLLAARLSVSNLHKETKASFSDVMEDLYNNKEPNESDFCKISGNFLETIKENAGKLNEAIIHENDFKFDYFEFKNIVVNHLKRINSKVVERPQHLLMRLGVAMHGKNIEGVLETYKLLSDRVLTLPFKNLLRAGTVRQQLATPFSVTMSDDSIEGIYDTLKNCGMISRIGGEVGLGVQCIRGMGSYIAGTNGNSNGLVPMIRVYNSMARYTHQGGQKASAKLTIYLEPWHCDILYFIDLKKSSGKEEGRARILNYGLLIPDLFMKRVESNDEWSLMCPDDSKGLADVWGEEFEELYTKYEKEGNVKRTVKARDLWEAILEGQIECGSPSILFKDSINRKSAIKHLGTVKDSNYDCCQMAASVKNKPVSCVGMTIRLDSFVTLEGQFDFQGMKDAVMSCVRCCDASINHNVLAFADDSVTKTQRHLGIGVAGLADTFIKMKYAFDSKEASRLNVHIFETLYYGALSASCKLAQKFGRYIGYEGSPMSKGILSFDMWGAETSLLHEWADLRKEIASHGVRNALLICIPASNDSPLHLGSATGIEPFESFVETGIMKKKDVKVVHPLLVQALTDRGIWTENGLEERIIENNGSVQGLTEIPKDVAVLFRTVWELPQKALLQMAADRAPYVDQGQSVVVRMQDVNYGKLTSMLFFAWNKGLKTGIYQLRTPHQNSLSRKTVSKIVPGLEEAKKNQEAMVCSLENKDECISCGS